MYLVIHTCCVLGGMLWALMCFYSHLFHTVWCFAAVAVAVANGARKYSGFVDQAVQQAHYTELENLANPEVVAH